MRLCGTDLHILAGRVRARRCRSCPGHEFAGEVVAVGTEVTELRGRRPGRGRPVAVLPRVPLLPARARTTCASGGPRSASPRAGGAAEFAVAPVANCVHAARARPHRGRRARSSRCPARCAATTCCARSSADHVLIYGSGHDGPDDAGAGQADRRRAASTWSTSTRSGWPRRRTLGCTATAATRRRARPPARLGRRHRRHRQRRGHPGRPGPGRQGRHLPAVRRRRLRGPRDDRAVPHLQPGDHHHRLDGRAAQLRARRRSCSRPASSTRRCSSATGSRWTSTRRPSSSSPPASAARSRSSPDPSGRPP